MSVCIQSPPSQYIFSNKNDSLSPPPTPGRKRLCLNLEDAAEIPFFFPVDKSILEVEQQQLSSLKVQEGELVKLCSNASLPRLHLKPRPRFGTEMNKPKIDIGKMPVAPFSFTGIDGNESSRRNLQEMIHFIPPPPLVAPLPPLASKSSSMPAPEMKLTARKGDVVRRSSAVTQGDVQKLPSIQRQGMDSKTRKVVRRNSTAARCA